MLRGTWGNFLRSASIVLSTLGVLVAASLCFGWMKRTSRMDAKLDRLIELQSSQEERLARLEARAGAAMRVPRSELAALPPGERSAIPALQEQLRAKEQMIASLQRRFESQTVDAAALSNERDISHFLSPANLHKADLPEAHGVGVECRRNSCRVEAAFASDADADITLQGLYTAIAPTLPVAQTFRTTAGDGSIQAIIYAEPARSPPPKTLH